MNIFQKFNLANNLVKAVNEVKAEAQANSEIGDKIQEIIADIISILEKLKALVPQVDKFVEAIIEIIKKYWKK